MKPILDRLRARPAIQLPLALLLGIAFGFLLEKGGVTRYDVIHAQLRLQDFTVVRVMLAAVVTGMLGVHLLVSLGWARLQPKPGGWGLTGLGSLIFGAGFALLGYCPGTVAGAVGRGALDALAGGVPGAIFGSWLLAACYPALNRTILGRGQFEVLTFPELLKLPRWLLVVPLVLAYLLWARGVFYPGPVRELRATIEEIEAPTLGQRDLLAMCQIIVDRPVYVKNDFRIIRKILTDREGRIVVMLAQQPAAGSGVAVHFVRGEKGWEGSGGALWNLPPDYPQLR